MYFITWILGIFVRDQVRWRD